MAQYIDKSALVAEIEKRRDAALIRQHNLEAIGQETILNEVEANELNRIISFINTLEVKEVDLKKEIQDKIYNHFYDLEGIAIAGTSIYATVDDMEHIAKHFFELGLKAQKGE